MSLLDLSAILQRSIYDALNAINTEEQDPSDPEWQPATVEDLDVRLWRQDTYPLGPAPQFDVKQVDRWVVAIAYPADDEHRDAFVYADGERLWRMSPGPMFYAARDSCRMPIGADDAVWATLGDMW